MRLQGITSRPLYLILTAATAVTLAACSASSSSTATPSAPSSQPAAPASASSVPASSAPSSAAAGTAANGLSGTWNGQYNGSYAGTFTLNWQEAGSQLSGTIHLSYPGTSEHITGTVAGGNIRFGTVGSAAITYSGTVAGNAMSGTYQVDDSGGDHGQWSASKSS